MANRSERGIKTNTTDDGIRHPKDYVKIDAQVDIGTIELPDFPTAPEQGQSITDFAKASIKDSVEGFVQGVVMGILQHVIDKSGENPKK